MNFAQERLDHKERLENSKKAKTIWRVRFRICQETKKAAGMKARLNDNQAKEWGMR
jgi:hypothetical protein